MPVDGGGARYHVPRDRSPVPAVLVGALVVVTLVSAQVSVAGGGGTPGTVAVGQEQADQQQTDPGRTDQGQTAPEPPGQEQTGQAAPEPGRTPEAEPTPDAAGPDGTAPAGTAPAEPGQDGTASAAPGADVAPGLPQPVEVTFAVGSDEPSGDAEALLQPLVQALLDDPGARVRVVGHASPSNDPVLEEQLSLRRALTVLDVLADEGLPAGRADVVAAGSTQAGRSVSGTDRRVTVEVVPG